MENQPDWKIRFDHELSTALQARSKGKEGMARVCARRAAGIIVGEYLFRRGLILTSPSAIQQLRYFVSLEDAPEEAREIAQHCLIHLDSQHKLPIDADLVKEAQWLEHWLLPPT